MHCEILTDHTLLDKRKQSSNPNSLNPIKPPLQTHPYNPSGSMPKPIQLTLSPTSNNPAPPTIPAAGLPHSALVLSSPPPKLGAASATTARNIQSRKSAELSPNVAVLPSPPPFVPTSPVAPYPAQQVVTVSVDQVYDISLITQGRKHKSSRTSAPASEPSASAVVKRDSMA